MFQTIHSTFLVQSFTLFQRKVASLSLLCWTISHNTTLHVSSCCLPVLFALRPPVPLLSNGSIPPAGATLVTSSLCLSRLHRGGN